MRCGRWGFSPLGKCGATSSGQPLEQSEESNSRVWVCSSTCKPQSRPCHEQALQPAPSPQIACPSLHTWHYSAEQRKRAQNLTHELNSRYLSLYTHVEKDLAYISNSIAEAALVNSYNFCTRATYTVPATYSVKTQIS